MFRKSGMIAVCMMILFAYCLSVPAAAGQTVVIDGDTTDSVAGNGAYSGGLILPGYGNPDGNTVIINQGVINGVVYGGGTDILATTGVSVSASGNTIIINDGELRFLVCGGYAVAADGNATASGNSITINGGEFSDWILGGYAAGRTVPGAVDSKVAQATHNTITLSGSPRFTNTRLLGGYIDSYSDAAHSDAFTGNTLNIWNYRQSGTVEEVANFQYYNFLLPADLGNRSVVLTVNGQVYLDNGLNGDDSVSSTFTGLNVMGGGPEMGDGYEVSLIYADEGTFQGEFSNLPDNTWVPYTGKKGFSLLYDWEVMKSGDGLIATRVGSPRAAPGAKSLSEGRLAGLALLNQGADLLAGSGSPAAFRAAAGRGAEANAPVAFAAGEGGESRYKTGSHVDVGGTSLLTGLAWSRGFSGAGSSLFGAFVEAGWARYDSLNDSSGSGSVRGGGDSAYYGGGLFGRIDFGGGSGSGGWHVGAGLRAGHSQVDFASNDLTDGFGRAASYDIGKFYYGAHAGTGYSRELADGSNVSLYGTYFHTGVGGTSRRILDDPVEFRRLVSNRVRGGARFSRRALSTAFPFTVSPYAGAAYEYEFSGDAEATAYGLPLDTPSLGGGTAMAELGVTLGGNGVSAEIGVRGYLGVRRGVSGGVRVAWEF